MSEIETKEIVGLPDHQDSAMAMGAAVENMSLEAVTKWIKNRGEVYDAVRLGALRIVRPSQWVNMGKSLYLTASGAEAVRGLFGITIESPTRTIEEGEDEEGRFFTFRLEGRASHPLLGSIPVLGTCSSRDPFFSKAQGKRKTAAEINEIRGDLEKAAFSNYRGNAVVQLLGLRSLTVADLQAIGVKVEAASTVSYASGAKGGQADTSLCSEPMIKRVYALAAAHGIAMTAVGTHLKEQAKKYGLDTNPPETVNDALRRIRRSDYNSLCSFLGAPDE